MEPLPSRFSPGGRRGLLVAGYVVWVALFFVVEGLGRMKCDMPSDAWVEAGADAHERALRGFRQVQAVDCLGRTPWYSYSIGVMMALAFIAPFVVVGLFARRILRLVVDLPFVAEYVGAMLYVFLWVFVLALSLGPLPAAWWFYDRFGVGR